MSPMSTIFEMPEMTAWTVTNPVFDWLVERLTNERLSVEESVILAEMKVDADEISLRDDARFRPTPFGRWILTDMYLANEPIFDFLNNSPVPIANLEHWLEQFDDRAGVRSVICAGDPRFVLTGSGLRLAKRELSDLPLIEAGVSRELEFVTHLPLRRMVDAICGFAEAAPEDDLLDLDDAASSRPLGWIRVKLPTPLNSRMFIVRIEDDSMVDNSGGVGRCDYVLFSRQSAPSREDEVVLVRGVNGLTGESFYRLRRVRREGAQIILVPSNQDRTTYPLMVLNEADGDLLEVVAKLEYALKPSMYDCAPLGLQPKDDCRARHRQIHKLNDKVTNFFRKSKLAGEASPAEMGARVICREPGPGCLQIELGPYPSFPSFIKQLRLQGDGWKKEVGLEGIRKKRVNVTVAPWSSRLTWQVVDSALTGLIDLESLDLEGLPTDRVTVFKLDQDEVGRLVKDNRLVLTESYRILIPPGRLATLAVPPPVVPIDGGWSVWSLEEMAIADRMLLVEQLTELDLELREEANDLQFVIVPPAEWCRMSGEGAYPRFLTKTGAVVSLARSKANVADELKLLLLSTAGYRFQTIPVGSPPLLRLTELQPGRYGIELSARDRGLDAKRVYFEMVEELPNYPQAGCRIALDGLWIDLEAGGALIRPPADLRQLKGPGGGKAPLMLEIEAPPGWPLTVYWRSTSLESLYRAHADLDGGYDIGAILAATQQRRENKRVGELILDLRELGRVVLRHQHQMNVGAINEALTKLVIDHAPVVRRSRGEYLTTIPLWFAPVLALFGYSIAESSIPAVFENGRVLRLIHEELTPRGYEKRVTRLIFLLKDLPTELDPHLQRQMDQILAQEGQRDSLLSDGLRWGTRRFQSTLPVKVRDLEWIIDEQEDFLDFLREVGEGI